MIIWWRTFSRWLYGKRPAHSEIKGEVRRLFRRRAFSVQSFKDMFCRRRRWGEAKRKTWYTYEAFFDVGLRPQLQAFHGDPGSGVRASLWMVRVTPFLLSSKYCLQQLPITTTWSNIIVYLRPQMAWQSRRARTPPTVVSSLKCSPYLPHDHGPPIVSRSRVIKEMVLGVPVILLNREGCKHKRTTKTR